MSDSSSPAPKPPRPVLEVAALFLRIGATAFGGPAAHIAMMRQDVIAKRKWIDEQHFLDLLGATNLIPGPNSSEMAMHIGYVRAGLRGLLAGGLGFLLPGMIMTLALAWGYVEYGTTPAAGWLLYGIKPVIIPLILVALWSLAQKAVHDWLTGVVGVLSLILYFAGVNFVLILVGGGLLVMLMRARSGPLHAALVPLPFAASTAVSAAAGTAAGAAAATINMARLAWVFFKIGALLYGSGYVLFAFMHAELVEHYGWLTEQQLIDAIAFGQMTPGPLSTTTTFIGYLLAGVPGALLATFAFYLPAFIVVALSNPLIPRIRRSVWASSLLDGVNVASLGLMTGVTWELARAAYPDVFTLALGAVAAVLMLRYNINSVGLVLFGAGMGLLSALY